MSALAHAQDAAANGELYVHFLPHCQLLYLDSISAGLYNAFHPVIDGKTFTEFPTVSLGLGHFTRVPLIVG